MEIEIPFYLHVTWTINILTISWAAASPTIPPPTITTSYEEWKRHCDKKGGRFEFVVCFHLTSFFKWLKVLHLCQQVFMAFVYISQLILKLRASYTRQCTVGKWVGSGWSGAKTSGEWMEHSTESHMYM